MTAIHALSTHTPPGGTMRRMRPGHSARRPYRPFQSQDEAESAVQAAERALRSQTDDPVIVQDMLLVAIAANILSHTDAVTNRISHPPDDPRQTIRRGFDWLARMSREPWDGSKTSMVSAAYRAGGFDHRSVLATARRPDAPAILRMLFQAIAGPAGRLHPASSFGRAVSFERLFDILAFKNRSRRFDAMAVAFAKAFGLLPYLKERNLAYMRGNHKRGDLTLNNYPKLIHVELATACNIRCRMCSITRPGRQRQRTFISFETLERLRPALPFISDCKLHGGGEPFLHPQIDRVLQLFSDEGVRLNTVTNANLITDRLGHLIGQTFSTLTVSVDGVDQETYEYVRVRGKWSKLLNGLAAINKHRGPDLKLIIGVVMLKCNIHQLPDLVRFAAEHGAQELQAAWLVPFHDLPWTQAEGLTDDPVRTNAFMAETRAVGRELGISVRIPLDLPVEQTKPSIRLTHKDTYHDLHGTTRVEGHCRLMYDRAMILVDGRVKPCGQSRTVHELGSIHARSFEQCWNGAGYQKLRATFNGGTLPRTCMSCNFIRSNQTGTARLVYT